MIGMSRAFPAEEGRVEGGDEARRISQCDHPFHSTYQGDGLVVPAREWMWRWKPTTSTGISTSPVFSRDSSSLSMKAERAGPLRVAHGHGHRP